MVNSNWDQSVEVRCRIEKARTVFNIEHTTNEEVLKRMDKTKEVTFTVKRST